MPPPWTPGQIVQVLLTNDGIMWGAGTVDDLFHARGDTIETAISQLRLAMTNADASGATVVLAIA